MFGSRNWPVRPARLRLALMGAALVVATIILPCGETLAQQVPKQKTPQAAPTAPGAAPNNSGQPSAPGAVEGERSPLEETPRGCPYLERPLNLIV